MSRGLSHFRTEPAALIIGCVAQRASDTRLVQPAVTVVLQTPDCGAIEQDVLHLTDRRLPRLTP